MARTPTHRAAVGAKSCTSDSECPGGPLAYCGLDGKCGYLEMFAPDQPPDWNRRGLGFSAGSRNRLSTRQRALTVGGAGAPYAWRQAGADCPTGYTKDATNREGCYITVADPFPAPPSRPSPGLTAGAPAAIAKIKTADPFRIKTADPWQTAAIVNNQQLMRRGYQYEARATPGITVGASHQSNHQAEHAAARGTRRVPPPSIPNGRYGGRRGTRYRYPGSSRSVRVGGSSLTNVGLTQCVPCSQVARAARG